jgi:DNA-binding CsgD family transcriptional regulator
VRCVLARAHHGRAAAVSLSPRESEIARMIAQGYPNKMIASVLEISVWTVSTHLRRIFAKLGVTSRAAMVTTMFTSRKL